MIEISMVKSGIEPRVTVYENGMVLVESRNGAFKQELKFRDIDEALTYYFKLGYRQSINSRRKLPV